MTPVGGKLGDLIGRRNIVLFSGIVSTVCGIGVGFSNSVLVYTVFRILLGAAMGSYISVPIILAREINPPEKVPKMLGILISGMAVGGLLGGFLAGLFMDMGFMKLAVTFPLIPLILGVILIVINIPNKKSDKKIKVDILGIIIMSISLSLLILTMNYAPKYGFKDIKVILGLVVGLALGVVFVNIEKKAEEPIIPLRLLKNRNYVTFLIIGFIGYFYMNTMNIYAPIVTMNVLNQPKSVAGILQLPRTIIVMILPVFAGAWVAKKKV